jgi:hypothetical protein
MALSITKRCNRCRQPMRNDGTEQNPAWVCNNPQCVKYVPVPEPEPTPEPEPEQTEETTEE